MKLIGCGNGGGPKEPAPGLDGIVGRRAGWGSGPAGGGGAFGACLQILRL